MWGERWSGLKPNSGGSFLSTIVTCTRTVCAVPIQTTRSTIEGSTDGRKVLAIRPDRAGNLLEVIWLELADDGKLVIHAMALRPVFHDLLSPAGEDTHD